MLTSHFAITSRPADCCCHTHQDLLCFIIMEAGYRHGGRFSTSSWSRSGQGKLVLRGVSQVLLRVGSSRSILKHIDRTLKVSFMSALLKQLVVVVTGIEHTAYCDVRTGRFKLLCHFHANTTSQVAALVALYSYRPVCFPIDTTSTPCALRCRMHRHP